MTKETRAFWVDLAEALFRGVVLGVVLGCGMYIAMVWW